MTYMAKGKQYIVIAVGGRGEPAELVALRAESGIGRGRRRPAEEPFCAGLRLLLVTVGLFFLYFFGLTRTGLLGPDEPRYAAIGRAMAATGDWITPRLWGQPWFEKPALLYWMTAAGFKAGLGAGLAPRLPVALASVAFLIYFFCRAAARIWGTRGLVFGDDTRDVGGMAGLQPRRASRICRCRPHSPPRCCAVIST